MAGKLSEKSYEDNSDEVTDLGKMDDLLTALKGKSDIIDINGKKYKMSKQLLQEMTEKHDTCL